MRRLLLQICVKQIQLNWLVCHFCGFLATKQFGSFKIFIYFVMTNSIILNYLVLSDIQWPLSTICSQSELPWPVCCVYCMWHVGSLELAGMGGEDARTEQHWIHPQVSIVLLQKKVKASEKIMLCHESIFFKSERNLRLNQNSQETVRIMTLFSSIGFFSFISDFFSKIWLSSEVWLLRIQI